MKRSLRRRNGHQFGAPHHLGLGDLTITDRRCSDPQLSAVAAYQLLAGDRDPTRVRLVVAQVRDRRERRALLRQLGAEALNGHGRGVA